MKLTPARKVSADIVAKLSNALDNMDDVSQDQLLIMLSEALDVINELVELADGAMAD